ncbi:MAG: hypothetical protein WC719_03985 [Patescibacteria group bacterium]|jgi:hypothetical protein
MDKQASREWNRYFLKNFGIKINKIYGYRSTLKKDVSVNVITKKNHREFIASAIVKAGTVIELISTGKDLELRPQTEGIILVFKILNPQLEIGIFEIKLNNLVEAINKQKDL